MGLYKLPKIIGKDKKPLFGARINWNHPMSQELIGAWLLNESGGNSAFNNLDGKSAMLSGGISWNNNQTNFTTANGRINAGPDPKFAISDGPFTISMRLLDADRLVVWRAFLSKCISSQNSGWVLRIGSGQTPCFTNYSAGTTHTVSTQLPSTETDMVYRRLGTHSSWFYNGVSQSINADIDIGTITYSSSFNLIIGNYIDGINDFGYVGLMDHVYIWNRALSDLEIASLHANPYQMFIHPVWDSYYVPAAVSPPTGGKSIFGYDSIFHAGGIIQT